MDNVALWLPALVWGALFLWSYWREPRQFRNAFFFFFFCACTLGAAAVTFNQWWITVPIFLVVAFTPVVTIVFMLVNEVILVRREGFSFAHALPLLFACAIVAWFGALPSASALQASEVVLGFFLAVTACGASLLVALPFAPAEAALRVHHHPRCGTGRGGADASAARTRRVRIRAVGHAGAARDPGSVGREG